MSKRCLICDITKTELAAQRRYNKHTIPCTSSNGRHRYAATRKRVLINPNQAELAVKYQG